MTEIRTIHLDIKQSAGYVDAVAGLFYDPRVAVNDLGMITKKDDPLVIRWRSIYDTFTQLAGLYDNRDNSQEGYRGYKFNPRLPLITLTDSLEKYQVQCYSFGVDVEDENPTTSITWGLYLGVTRLGGKITTEDILLDPDRIQRRSRRSKTYTPAFQEQQRLLVIRELFEIR